MDFPTWDQMTEEDESPLQYLLIQAIAALSGQGHYTVMTPEEVYEEILERARSIEKIV